MIGLLTFSSETAVKLGFVLVPLSAYQMILVRTGFSSCCACSSSCGRFLLAVLYLDPASSELLHALSVSFSEFLSCFLAGKVGT